MRSFSTGTYVRIKTTGQLARVYYPRPRNGAPFNDEHLQNHPEKWGPDPMRFVNVRWCTVLPDNNQSEDYYPEDLLEEVEPFVLDHIHKDLYFGRD